MELTIPLLLVCGLALLCVVILAVGFFGVRFLWNNFGRVITEFNRSEQEDEDAQQAVRLPRRRGNLRAKAEAVDFDSALAAASTRPNPDQTSVPSAPQNLAPARPPTQAADPLDAPPPATSFDDDDVLGDRGRQFRDRLRRRDSGERYDATYGEDERNEGDEGGLGGLF